MRSDRVDTWLGALLVSTASLSWLCLILDSEQAMNLFYIFGIAHVFLFTFAGYAFHQAAPFLKKSKITISLVLVAFYFPLIQALIEKGYLIFAAVGMIGWLMLCIAAIQQLGELITFKKSQEVDSMVHHVLLLIFLVGVIALTLLKLPLLQLLNHPSNL